MVSRVSTTPRPKIRRTLGFHPSASARMATHRPTAPTRIADQIRAETNHSLGSRMPAGRYHGGSKESRGPRVMVTADGPRNPAIRVSPCRRRCRTGPSGGCGARPWAGRSAWPAWPGCRDACAWLSSGVKGSSRLPRSGSPSSAESLEQAAPGVLQLGQSGPGRLAGGVGVDRATSDQSPGDVAQLLGPVQLTGQVAAGRPVPQLDLDLLDLSPARRMSMVIPTSIPQPAANGLASSNARRVRQR